MSFKPSKYQNAISLEANRSISVVIAYPDLVKSNYMIRAKNPNINTSYGSSKLTKRGFFELSHCSAIY